ncbi:butyrophilin subfamily 1 member A1-like isoform 3-T3 [Acanthopagrus schlegelii]
MDLQNPSFKGRTSLSEEKLKSGDISLKLSNVKPSDEGKYRCFIPTLHKETTLKLVVGVVSSIFISLEKTRKDEVSSGLVLQCKSTGWYPEPEVFWLDGEGNLLSAGPTETVRGPDDLYTVSSRVTVEKRHSNSFTCRVQQNSTNQIREAKIYVPEDVFMEPSSSAVPIIMVFSFVCVLLFSALVFAVWKLRRNKSHKSWTVNGQKKMEHPDEGKLKEKVEEKTYMMYVFSVLMEKMNELEHHRDKLMSQIERVETERTENEKKLQSVIIPVNKKNLSEIKLQLDYKKTEYEKSLQRIEGRIQTTEDFITRITERMKKVEKQVKEMNEQPEDKSVKEIRFNFIQIRTMIKKLNRTKGQDLT